VVYGYLCSFLPAAKGNYRVLIDGDTTRGEAGGLVDGDTTGGGGGSVDGDTSGGGGGEKGLDMDGADTCGGDVIGLWMV
jgi:hypothetical protein